MSVSSYPNIPSLRSEGCDSAAWSLLDWATSFLASHQSPQAVLDWKIVSIRWYKKKGGLEHEYSVFTLQNQSSGDTIFLRFDRSSSPEALNTKKEESVVKQDVYLPLNRKNRDKVKNTIQGEIKSMRRKGSKWIVQSSKTSSGKEGGFEPEDTVMRTWQANGADKDESRKIELLATYSGFSLTFSLRDLAIIAKAVLAKSDRYLLLMQQCYWFTRTLVQISVAIYSPQSAGSINTGGLGRSGRINHLSFLPVINEDNPAEITLLVERVNRSISVDDQEVQARYMKGEGGIIEMQKQLDQKDNTILELRVQIAVGSYTGCPSV